MNSRLLVSASTVVLAAAAAFVGCSSSSTGNNGSNPDSGTSSGGGTDSSTGSGDSGGNTNEDSATTGGDTGTTPTGDGSTSNSCAPATDAGTYTSVTYVPATTGTNECASADIAAFVAACVTSTNQSDCPNWFAANVAGQAADGGGAGTTCGNCIAPANNNGGAWIDPEGYVYPNYAGCIQLTDPTNGATCAAAYNNANGCTDLYCDQCSNDTFQGCSDAATATGGACASYNTTLNSACATDLSADAGTAVCFPSETSGAMDASADFTYIINLICGTGQ